jgi:hypothetical protein
VQVVDEDADTHAARRRLAEAAQQDSARLVAVQDEGLQVERALGALRHLDPRLERGVRQREQLERRGVPERLTESRARAPRLVRAEASTAREAGAWRVDRSGRLAQPAKPAKPASAMRTDRRRWARTTMGA